MDTAKEVNRIAIEITSLNFKMDTIMNLLKIACLPESVKQENWDTAKDDNVAPYMDLLKVEIEE